MHGVDADRYIYVGIAHLHEVINRQHHNNINALFSSEKHFDVLDAYIYTIRALQLYTVKSLCQVYQHHR